MKRISLCLIWFLSACGMGGNPSIETASEIVRHEIYLVRHAEKQAGDDPSLTAAGVERAELLAQILGDKGVTNIHSTNLKRTLETAAPLATQTGLEVALYDPSDLDAFADTLEANVGVHLVVGHSNTTPQLATALGGDPGREIDEATEYDRLYVITLSEDPIASRIDRFGVRYQPDAVLDAE